MVDRPQGRGARLRLRFGAPESGRINVRFGALSGHKPDIVSCPLSADFVAKVPRERRQPA
jgi:hypothetical protein